MGAMLLLTVFNHSFKKDTLLTNKKYKKGILWLNQLLWHLSATSEDMVQQIWLEQVECNILQQSDL